MQHALGKYKMHQNFNLKNLTEKATWKTQALLESNIKITVKTSGVRI